MVYEGLEGMIGNEHVLVCSWNSVRVCSGFFFLAFSAQLTLLFDEQWGQSFAKMHVNLCHF